MLPGGSGDIEVDLKLRLELDELLGLRRQLFLVGRDESVLDGLTDDFGWQADFPAPPVHEFVPGIRESHAYSPVFAASIDYLHSTQELEITPRWALITEPTLAIKDGGSRPRV